MIQDHNHVDQYGNPAPCNLREQFEVAEVNVTINEIECADNSDLYVEPAPIYIPDPDPRSIRPMESGCANKLAHAALFGGTVTLSDDLVIDAPLNIKNNVVLDLNGHSITNVKDIWDEARGDWSLISVREGGNLTVLGQGTMKAKENDCYAIDVKEGGHCAIKGGTFVGNISAVYVHTGSLVIQDGNFSVQQKSTVGKPEGYVVNCLDKNCVEGIATVSILGGTYKGFDPTNTPELEGADKFLEEGYKVTESNGYFTVTAE